MAAGDWKEMLLATEQGDLELVRYHLKMGVDPNYQHPEFLTTPLIESIRFGNLEIAQLLLEHKADPNIEEGFSKETAMSVAKASRNKRAITLLLSHGAHQAKKPWYKAWF